MAMRIKPHQRIQDKLDLKDSTHKMNFDRRLKNNERRNLDYSGHIYNGPARRLTILDRRVNPGDRRSIDSIEKN